MQQDLRKLTTILLLISCSMSSKGQGIITTICGNGITEYIGDGFPATAFALAGPTGIWVDKNKNVLVADFEDMRIRKIDPQDTLFTIYGVGSPGYSGDSGMASAAHLRNPDGVCMDTAGNVYITEWYNDVVRKVDATTGIITTVCGNGTGGYGGDNGPATAANMETPGPAWVDNAGNIYIPDYGNHRIRKVNAATGIITTIAGVGVAGYTGDNGAATAATLSYPNSVTVDTSGNVFISDYGNNCIRRVDAVTGIITTVVGTGAAGYFGDGGIAVAARLRHPNYVFADKKGFIYLSDNGNNVIRAVNASGFIHTVAGTGEFGYSGDGGPATAAKFNSPASVYVNDSGIIFIADGLNSVIRRVDPGKDAVQNITKDNTFSMYPDPCDGKFTLVIPYLHSETSVTVYNCMGQMIYQSAISDQHTDVDLSTTPAGIYYVQCSSSEGTTTRKLVVR